MTGLLGPNGRPISSSEFKKAKDQPILGEAFGVWGPNADIRYANLPGIGIVQFDLSKLTLADYKVMRDHYQVNASLNVLSFMQHQSDWHIECENQKIADECERQLRNIWTQLNRAMSVANWSGYSPNILQWENNDITSRTELAKVKDLDPASCAVNWKEVDGWVPPGSNAKNKLKIYDGIKQIGAPWPIPTDNSFWYSMLMENNDYMGRKLLRPAFTSWFFSILIHMFANRYFERYGEPVVKGRAPFENDVQLPDGTKLNGLEYMISVMKDLRNRAVIALPDDKTEMSNGRMEFDYDISYLECVDEKTEILTRQGWKFHDEVKVGDEVYTLNHKTGLGEWNKIQKLNVFDADHREMLQMSNSTHSSLTTLNHRWPVIASDGQREFRFSSNLKNRDKVPVCAVSIDCPKEKSYSDAFVKLVAWYWTEGHLYKTGNYASITQKVYPIDVRDCLTELFGAPVDRFRHNTWANGKERTPDVPKWRENSKSSDPSVRQFFLNYEATNLLTSVATGKGKIVSYEFLNSLTYEQLQIFFDVSMKADGNPNNQRQNVMMQKSREAAERFQYVCTLLGIPTSFYKLKPDPRWVNDTGLWVVGIKRNEIFVPNNTKMGSGVNRVIRYSGKVWCPTVTNETWLARRNGTVYFTGNSQMRGADWERYLTRLDEEISIGLFTPILLLRTADVGSYNLGVGHMQMYLWMLNAMNDDRAQYINKYILSRMTDFNFSVKAPRPRIVFRKLGNQNADVLVQVMKYLTQGGRISFDYKELGEIVGMTVTEVKQTIEDASGDSNNPDDPSNEEDNSSVSDGADE